MRWARLGLALVCFWAMSGTIARGDDGAGGLDEGALIHVGGEKPRDYRIHFVDQAFSTTQNLAIYRDKKELVVVSTTRAVRRFAVTEPVAAVSGDGRFVIYSDWNAVVELGTNRVAATLPGEGWKFSGDSRFVYPARYTGKSFDYFDLETGGWTTFKVDGEGRDDEVLVDGGWVVAGGQFQKSPSYQARNCTEPSLEGEGEAYRGQVHLMAVREGIVYFGDGEEIYAQMLIKQGDSVGSLRMERPAAMTFSADGSEIWVIDALNGLFVTSKGSLANLAFLKQGKSANAQTLGVTFFDNGKWAAVATPYEYSLSMIDVGTRLPVTVKMAMPIMGAYFLPAGDGAGGVGTCIAVKVDLPYE